MKKYELTQETIEVAGKKLYTIKALRDFDSVRAGDLGGFIETENNLNHEGNAWIFDTARVFDNARVYGNAKVFQGATVSGNAKVAGNTSVFGNAEVYGNARVFDHARVYGNARVHGNARVYDSARVSGTAEVYSDAVVFGDASVSGAAVLESETDIILVSNVGSEGGTLTVFTGKDGLLATRGCFCGTVEEFLSAVEDKHGDNQHAQLYRLLIQAAKLRITGSL